MTGQQSDCRADSLTPDQRAHLVAMTALPFIGPARLRCLHERPDPTASWQALLRRRLDAVLQLREPESAAIAAAAAEFDVFDHLERHAAGAIRVDVLGEPGYPEVLAADHEAPIVLFTRGAPLGSVSPSVGIVGTRDATGYGRSFAFDLGAALIANGVSVISGLALGVDAAAHSGAIGTLGARGDSASATDRIGVGSVIGVVGCGLDRVYPARNRALHHAVIERGSLISEVPIGTVPARWRFPARNRIIAALSDVLVVVESAAAGGSMITVDEATTRSRTVLAVPGPVTSSTSDGTNQLLADGCGPCRHLDDVLTALDLSPTGAARDGSVVAACGVTSRLSPVAREVLAGLEWTPTPLDRLAIATGRSFGELCAALDELVVAGLARSVGGRFERTALR